MKLGKLSSRRAAAFLAAFILCSAALHLLYSDRSQLNTPKENGPVLIVMAAPVIKPLLDKIREGFENIHNVELLISYEASGAILTKLAQRAPVDIVIFASEEYGNEAVSEGLVIPNSETRIAFQLLYIYVNSSLPFSDNIACTDDLANYEIKIGLVNPQVSPGGKEAISIINQSKVKNELLSKVVYAKDMGELVTWYRLGAVDAAFAWSVYSEELSDSSKIIYPWKCGARVGVYSAIGYITSYTDRAELASLFIDYLKTDEVKRVAEELGYFPDYESAVTFVLGNGDRAP